jgi:hypothetical protein
MTLGLTHDMWTENRNIVRCMVFSRTLKLAFPLSADIETICRRARPRPQALLLDPNQCEEVLQA